MSIVKMAAGFACGVIILLFILTITIKNTECIRYTETVEMLMKQEGLVSTQEADQCFPVLVEIRANMTQIEELNKYVHRKTHCPAPIINEEESRQLTDYIQTIRQLRHQVESDLIQLVAAYVVRQI